MDFIARLCLTAARLLPTVTKIPLFNQCAYILYFDARGNLIRCKWTRHFRGGQVMPDTFKNERELTAKIILAVTILEFLLP